MVNRRVAKSLLNVPARRACFTSYTGIRKQQINYHQIDYKRDATLQSKASAVKIL